jgi:hypothetical protein
MGMKTVLQGYGDIHSEKASVWNWPKSNSKLTRLVISLQFSKKSYFTSVCRFVAAWFLNDEQPPTVYLLFKLNIHLNELNSWLNKLDDYYVYHVDSI